MNHPLVSAIITTYNYGHYLSEAIDSILSQTYNPIEVIVIDDGSTDDTFEKIKQYHSRIQYHYMSNQGVSRALNKGIELSTGEYIGFLDADDLWRQNKIALQMKEFNRDPSLEIVFGHIAHFHSTELTIAQRARFKCPDESLPGISKTTILVKRNVFDKIGNFNLQNNNSDFVEWFSRVKNASIPNHMLTEIVTDRRIHASNMTIKHKTKHQKEVLDLLRARLKGNSAQ